MGNIFRFYQTKLYGSVVIGFDQFWIKVTKMQAGKPFRIIGSRIDLDRDLPVELS